MFSSDEDFVPPSIPARQSTRSQTGLFDGLGAAFTMEAMETDRWSRMQRNRDALTGDVRDAVRATLGDDEVDARLAEAFPPSRRTQPSARQRAEDALFLEWAAEAAEQSPETFRDLPSSREALDEAARARYQAEYDDAAETMEFMGFGRGVTEFFGRTGAAATDPTSLLLGAVSGGSGSIARVVAREAALGAFGEALVLPRMYRMSEYLEIDDPNAVAQLAMGAAFGAGLYGAGRVATNAGRAQISAEFARALEYARGRTQAIPEPLEPTIEVAATIDNVEAAIEDDPAIFDVAPRPREAPIVREESPIQQDDPGPMLEEDAPDPIIAGFEQDIEAARAEAGTRSQPITTYLLSRSHDQQLPGGGVSTLQVHPEGRAAAELRSMGITNRTRPGLFSRRGMMDFDNLPASEWEDELPGITDAAGMSDDGLYLDQSGFLRVLADELNGNPSQLRDRQRLDELEVQMDEYMRLREMEDERFDPIPDTSDVTELQRSFQTIEAAVDDLIRARGIDDLVSPSERSEMVQYLAERGGRPSDLLDDIDTRDLDFGEADLESDDGRPFAEPRPDDLYRDDPANAGQLPEGAGRAGADGQDPGATGGGRAGEGADRGPSTERTAAGEQTLIPGVEPITELQRLQQRQAQPLAGVSPDNDSQIGGLFDPYAKERTDLFSDPTAKPAVDLNRAAANDMREAIETEGDFQVSMLDADGETRTMSASQWLDDLDAETDFVEIAELCGLGGGTQ